MNDIDVLTCVVCHTEKSVDDFYKKYRECKACNIKRVLRRYYNKKKYYNNVVINMHVLETWIID